MKPYYEDAFISLYLGDSRVVLPELGITPDLVVADPPYGDTHLDWDRWPDGWVDVVASTTPPPCPLWCFGSMRMFLNHGADFAAYRFGQDVIWEKHNGSGFQADRFKRVHEHVIHWYRGKWTGQTINPQFTHDANKRTFRRKQHPPHMAPTSDTVYETEDGGPKLTRSVQFVRSMQGSAINETEKPTGILEPLILYSSNPGDLVVDPFAGSCSTLDTARRLGRRAIGIELREEQCEAAARRLDQQVLDLSGPQVPTESKLPPIDPPQAGVRTLDLLEP